MDTTRNYQVLAHAIVLKAIEDSRGDGPEAQQAREWLRMQGVLEVDIPVENRSKIKDSWLQQRYHLQMVSLM